MPFASDQHGLLYERGHMMGGIKQYLLSVMAAAIISALVITIIGKKGAHAAIVKLLTGLFLAMTVVSPWTKLQINDLSSYLEGISHEADSISSEAIALISEERASIIKKEIEAYILDKAALLELDIKVDVELSGEDPPIPHTVTISGAVSPYAKQRLQSIISDELGVPKEQQSWI